MVWIIITLGTIFLLLLSLCAKGGFLSIAVFVFLCLFTYLPFSRRGMIICCGLNMTQTEHVSKSTHTIFVENSHMLLQGTESWFIAKCHFLLPQGRNRVAEEQKRITSSCSPLLQPPALFCHARGRQLTHLSSSGRLMGRMTFADLDCADVAINWKNI